MTEHDLEVLEDNYKLAISELRNSRKEPDPELAAALEAGVRLNLEMLAMAIPLLCQEIRRLGGGRPELPPSDNVYMFPKGTRLDN